METVLLVVAACLGRTTEGKLEYRLVDESGKRYTIETLQEMKIGQTINYPKEYLPPASAHYSEGLKK